MRDGSIGRSTANKLAAAVPGNAAIGHLTDRWPMSITIFVSSAVTAASCLLLWGFGTSNAVLIVFSIVYGTFGLSFTALWTRMISIISRDDPHAPQLVFSIFAFLRGVGNITSGPISDALLKLETLQGAAGAYGFRNYVSLSDCLAAILCANVDSRVS